jgi:hypothetical protein
MMMTWYFRLTELGTKNDDGVVTLPNSVPCTFEALDHHGVYLIDLGTEIIILLCFNAKDSAVQNVDI